MPPSSDHILSTGQTCNSNNNQYAYRQVSVSQKFVFLTIKMIRWREPVNALYLLNFFWRKSKFQKRGLLSKIVVCNISNTKDSVSSHLKTPKSKLKYEGRGIFLKLQDLS